MIRKNNPYFYVKFNINQQKNRSKNMPVEKSNVKYGCERCSVISPSQGNYFVEIQQFGRFRHTETNNLIEMFMCPQCNSVYIKMQDTFIPGFFHDESASLGGNFR